MSVKRIYISGIKEEHTDEMLREHFLQYGTITEVHIVVDKTTNLKRGFAFITFDDYDSADKAVRKWTVYKVVIFSFMTNFLNFQ